MPRVSWSARAEFDLKFVVTNPAVRDQLKHNAEVTLHDVQACTAHEGGAASGIMWHRGITHEQERRIEAEWLPERADGPQVWDYFFLYRRQKPGPGFEVLSVRSTEQIARWWEHMNRESARAAEPQRVRASAAAEVEQARRDADTAREDAARRVREAEETAAAQVGQARREADARVQAATDELQRVRAEAQQRAERAEAASSSRP